ncbi:Pentatricopeptide repeat-containing protein, mitochondrial [Sesamum angolense]|uniref:Pentatricopeptide repeat-containing protein, mitochondrial n=1 Tax=Sesamum angolense TaxID=2727404 RepID=A0AAE1XC63_9LAMI|nr:Pentatricopeptide repeat-containing protein, mitochondrial [Sesamum angolense]
MRVIAFVLQEQRAFGAICRTLSISGFCPKNLRPFGSLSIPISSCVAMVPAETSEESGKESKDGEPKSLSWRIEKLPRGESVASAFQNWMGDGLPIHRGDIFHTINRLRKLKSTKRALEVRYSMICLLRDGMGDKGEALQAKRTRLLLLARIYYEASWAAQGETLFSRIPSEFQNELLYNNLVLGCLEKGLIRLSLAYMKKMRELGHPISYLAFNRLIILHSSPSRRKAIPKILTQMKADKVVPHVSTYNIFEDRSNEHNIEGLVKVFGDMKRLMVEPNEISYCILAMAHAVARLYTVCEAYVEAIEKFMTGHNWSTLDILVILYGYLRKQKELIRTWSMIQELPYVRGKSFVLAIEAFGKTGNLGRAEELWLEMASKKGLKSTAVQFNDRKCGKVFEELKKANYTRYTFVYNTLIKSYVKAKVYEPNLLRRMILEGP